MHTSKMIWSPVKVRIRSKRSAIQLHSNHNNQFSHHPSGQASTCLSRRCSARGFPYQPVVATDKRLSAHTCVVVGSCGAQLVQIPSPRIPTHVLVTVNIQCFWPPPIITCWQHCVHPPTPDPHGWQGPSFTRFGVAHTGGSGGYLITTMWLQY